MSNVHSVAVERGESLNELKKTSNSVARRRATEFEVFLIRAKNHLVPLLTVDVTHTRVLHCSPLGQIQVFLVRNTRDVIYSSYLGRELLWGHVEGCLVHPILLLDKGYGRGYQAERNHVKRILSSNSNMKLIIE